MSNNKIAEQIQSFIDKTNENLVKWNFLNANAVRFTKIIPSSQRHFTITLQKVAGGIRENYSFIIQTSNPNQVLIQIQTTTDATHIRKLKELFDLAIIKSQLDSADVIDELLDNL